MTENQKDDIKEDNKNKIQEKHKDNPAIICFNSRGCFYAYFIYKLFIYKFFVF